MAFYTQEGFAVGVAAAGATAGATAGAAAAAAFFPPGYITSL